MKIASVLENQKIEKRIAITPEIAKKYLSLGLEVILCENYSSHLGISDNEYKDLGVKIFKDEKEIQDHINYYLYIPFPNFPCGHNSDTVNFYYTYDKLN